MQMFTTFRFKLGKREGSVLWPLEIFADHEIELPIVGGVESSQQLDHGWVHFGVSASFRIIQALFCSGSGHLDAEEAFRCIEGKVVATNLIVQAEELFHAFHLREGIVNQTVAVHEQDLMRREELRQKTNDQSAAGSRKRGPTSVHRAK